MILCDGDCVCSGLVHLFDGPGLKNWTEKSPGQLAASLDYT